MALEDGQDPLLEVGVEHHLAAAEGADHVGREVVRGGAEPAGRDDQVDPLRGEKVERGAHVRGTVADDHDVRELDPGGAQALGQPRAVAVADDAAEHLRARHDDAGADAHPLHVGRRDSGSGRGFPPARSS